MSVGIATGDCTVADIGPRGVEVEVEGVPPVPVVVNVGTGGSVDSCSLVAGGILNGF